jgi:RNA polymerase sigma factor (sigma-70 family)
MAQGIPHPDLAMDETLCLVRKAQDGDRKAIDALFERFAPYVEKIVSILLGCGGIEDADDYVQDCLLKAYRSLGKFKADEGGGNFRGWLKAIARSVILDEKKRWSRVKRGAGRVKRWSDYGSSCLASSILPPAPGETPSGMAIQREEEALRDAECARRTESALRDLKEHERKLILMREACGLSFAEMATHLGIQNVEAVRKAYYRARTAFRKALA